MSIAAQAVRDGLAAGALTMALLGSQVFEANLTEQTRNKNAFLNSADTNISIGLTLALVLAAVTVSAILRGLLTRPAIKVATPVAVGTLIASLGVPIAVQGVLSALDVDMAPAEFNALGFVVASTSMGVGALVMHNALNT